MVSTLCGLDVWGCGCLGFARSFLGSIAYINPYATLCRPVFIL
jgi:hypothetical protein